MSIQEHLNKIRNAIYGKEVRESIAKGIETAYDDASEKDNANMEVKIARGTHPTLRDRLNEVDNTQQQTSAQLAQKANLSIVRHKNTPIGLNDVNGDLLSAIQGGTNVEVLSIPRDYSVTGNKMYDVSVTSQTDNLFDKETRMRDGYFEPNQDGAWVDDNSYDSSNFIPVKPNVQYQKTGRRSYCLWGKDKKFITGGSSTDWFNTTSETAYVTFAIEKDLVDETKLMRTSEWVEEYVPFVPKNTFGDSWEVKKEPITGDDFKDVSVTSQTDNLFDKETRLQDGYFEASQDGAWIMSTSHDSSNFIPVKPNVQYQKTGLRGFSLWDKDKNFITGGSSTDWFNTTSETAYVTFTMDKDLVDETKFMETSKWVEEYVPFIPKYVLGKSWGLAEVNTDIHNGTNDLFLRVPTPYHDNTNDVWATHQTTHPSIVQFDDGWNGWKYWMAHTPYPHGRESAENPCIAVSNNGIKWEEPEGVSNPLVEAPSGGGYNSDGHMFYNQETQMLELWYREVSSDDVESIIRLTSNNGVDWSNPETMIVSTEDGLLNLISPSVIYTDGEYKMWFMRQRRIMYMTSPNGENWSEPIHVLSDGEQIRTWHLEVSLHDEQYHLLNHVDGIYIKHSTSVVGEETNFSTEEIVIESTGNEWDLDGFNLYRASLMFTDSNIIIIYGTRSYQGDWLLHAVSGRTFDKLKPITRKAFEFYNIDMS